MILWPFQIDGPAKIMLIGSSRIKVLSAKTMNAWIFGTVHAEPESVFQWPPIAVDNLWPFALLELDDVDVQVVFAAGARYPDFAGRVAAIEPNE
jgi:hypothetical protein